ncbi:RNA polymerase sigma factor [Gemmatimonas sp.]|jgi:RNA polymerase sigma-70 factor (ECF subfamily)|uniref:RNA polymerase sigma factor n=1 Tax=Gemmatimonas sp. TaxID=1962908 RepID=UPI0022BC58C7|nr:RNA polymerase sigma factor [Gemmatimonas sp.]MCA2985097.1 RNA polymerase sigma factor [Gemmatimonas sp.]MCA2987186.1 RNA polymerase sigma factor [Gemmatimonas sp.]MCA2989738.1 RNA polymerase sigma factor [Gemmatimonas sp.]MCA2994869.1 RNA polymerase sigma factor [Gemmatimonas sp.]MCE2955453.1 RNA polymerase sigma factor [Gemmatimonas sp.]
MTDAELVVRTRAGDPEAFGSLVARYYDACWRFAYHMLGERADAEDVVQDSFLRAYLAIGRYDERDQFRGWLFRILTNQCRNYLTSRGRRTRRFVQDDVAIESAAAPPPGLAPGVEDDVLIRALAQLDPLQREALLLKYAEGLEYSEMSAMTGAGESALKMRVKRGSERLRALLSASPEQSP